MRNFAFRFLVLFSMVSMLGACGSDDPMIPEGGVQGEAPPTVGVEIHDNDVFLLRGGLNTFDFSLSDDTSYCISEGQPWGGILSGMDESDPETKGRITARAGRHKTSDCANWFADQVGAGSAMGCDSGAHLPDELNFAFVGTLKFSLVDHPETTYVCENVAFAQGSRENWREVDTRNNWWIGGWNMTGIQLGKLAGGILQKCTASENKLIAPRVAFTKSNGCTNEFSMSILFKAQ